MGIVRTVLGDIQSSEMGITYSHEHIIIEDSFPTRENPDFLLNDVEKISRELREVYEAGGRTMIDTMPSNVGRNIKKLVEVSKASGINIVAPTGIHLEIYYPAYHWRYSYTEDQLVGLFTKDIEVGIDVYDYNGPIVDRTDHKAGLIKLATGDKKFSAHQELLFHAVAETHHITGVPILTHTNYGKQALEQSIYFDKLGVDLNHVILSHLDRNKDIDYHREVLNTGVNVEYDSSFRWNENDNNWTYYFLERLLPEYPSQICIGMDAARNTYWKSYGGYPGIDFLLKGFYEELKKRDLIEFWDNLMIHNPSSIFSFSE